MSLALENAWTPALLDTCTRNTLEYYTILPKAAGGVTSPEKRCVQYASTPRSVEPVLTAGALYELCRPPE